MSAYKHLLIAVDFSPNTDEIVQQALALSQGLGSRISLIHVVEFAQVDLSNELVMPQELELDQELLKLARQRLTELVEKHGLPSGCDHVCQGSTKREIINFATEAGVDLIVIGSHGRSGIQLLLGSTANAVLHSAPCDVLAVRLKA